ncbi:CDP-glycerol glycerophosphotransferase family protein [Halorussus amylolyticus]|uniref:CDP-glycerol glycerophosphotransferase family protein n=1 Tax=Halorussus amylolyticus TaxID=1126242 RepID=UPI00138F4E96|nr:CDP-glycerol glycerophosphotransferase family protein [Halorussus amylolyticus]
MSQKTTSASVRARTLALAGAASFLLQTALYAVLKALSRFRTRDDSLWAFGARGGEAFADNSKYLYLHVAAEHPDVRAVWLSKNREVVADLQDHGYEAYHCHSLRGLLANLRAGVVFLTQGHRDLLMPCCAGAFTVMLWHGVPLKRISWDAEFVRDPAPIQAARAYIAREFDLLTIPGGGVADPFESGLRIPRDRMVATGYPRNDALFGPIRGEEVGTDSAALARVRDLAERHPVVCYLPTYREGEETVAENLDARALDDLFADRDAYLVVKTHPKERLDLPPDLSRIVHLSEKTDVYPLLRETDALLTDYSSVYFDYLLLDRPVAFYPFDRESYTADRGFYFDYDEVVAGPVASDFPELLDALGRALDAVEAPDSDPDADRRRAVRRAVFDAETQEQRRAAAVCDVVEARLRKENSDTS